MSFEPIPNIQEPLLNHADPHKITQRWHSWLRQLLPTPTFSGTITTAKLTGGGTNGSITFVNGIVTKQTQAT